MGYTDDNWCNNFYDPENDISQLSRVVEKSLKKYKGVDIVNLEFYEQMCHVALGEINIREAFVKYVDKCMNYEKHNQP